MISVHVGLLHTPSNVSEMLACHPWRNCNSVSSAESALAQTLPFLYPTFPVSTTVADSPAKPTAHSYLTRGVIIYSVYIVRSFLVLFLFYFSTLSAKQL